MSPNWSNESPLVTWVSIILSESHELPVVSESHESPLVSESHDSPLVSWDSSSLEESNEFP